MTEKELRKLSRADLLEIMIEQQKQINRLEKEVRRVEDVLRTRNKMIKDSETLAEASLRLSEVYAAAREAANLYLDNIGRAKDVRGDAPTSPVNMTAERMHPAVARTSKEQRKTTVSTQATNVRQASRKVPSTKPEKGRNAVSGKDNPRREFRRGQA